MPKCPKCEKELNYLWLQEDGLKTYTVSLIGGKLSYEEYNFEPFDVEKDSYECPYCNQIIAENAEEALDILTDKIENTQEL